MKRTGPYLAMLVGALVPMAGVLTAPGSRILGEPFSDANKHVWAYWHTLTTLLEGTWPYTQYLNAPQGGVLQDVMIAPSLLLLPVTAIGGAVLASNVWVLLSVWFVGVSTFWLARAIVGGTAGPLTAGLLAQTSPFMMGYPLHSGVHERLAIWIFPLAALALLRARTGAARRWDAPALGAATLVAAVGCQVYGIFLVVTLLMAAPFVVWPVSRSSVRAVVPALVAIGIALVVALGFAQWLSNHPESLVPQAAGRLDTQFGVIPFAAKGAVPAELLTPWGVAAQKPIEIVDRIWCLAYLGWVPLIAAVGGMVLARRSKLVGLVTGLGLASAFLAMGPRFEVAGSWMWSPPFHAIAAVVPYYGSTPPVWQQAGIFPVLAAVGMAAFVVRTRWWVGILLVVGAGVERAVVLPVGLVVETTPVEVSEGVASIDGGAVFQIPAAWQSTLLATPGSFRGQIQHQQPIAATIETVASAWGRWLPYLRGYSHDWSDSLQCMGRAGFRWLLIDRSAVSWRQQIGELEAVLAREVGPPVHDDGALALYDLAPLGVVAETVDMSPVARMTVELEAAGVLGSVEPGHIRSITKFLECPLDAAPAPRHGPDVMTPLPGEGGGPI